MRRIQISLLGMLVVMTACTQQADILPPVSPDPPTETLSAVLVASAATLMPSSTPIPTETPTLAAPTETPTLTPTSLGPTVYQCGEEGHWDICYRGIDGVEINITNDTIPDFFPVLSPDGTEIAFSSFRDDSSVVLVADINGTEIRRVTQVDLCRINEVDWSPDGTMIAFAAIPPDEPCWKPLDIFVVNTDGTGFRNITNTPYSEMAPEWSSDGSVVYFLSDIYGINGFNLEASRYQVNVEGPPVTQRPTYQP